MSLDNLKTEQYAQKRIVPYMLGIFIVLCSLQMVAVFLGIRFFSLQQTRSELNDFTKRVAQGLSYQNGKWDTTKYTSDPETPHPSGSSGFSTPLYIIAADGFVIERNAPIPGILDSSDFSHLMEFQQAQTISVVTNEQWRIMSRPLVHNGKTIGVIVGALYHPERFVPNVSDSKLLSTINYLEKAVPINNGVIDVSNVDVRGVDYDISFEIVSNFNKVLLNNGRMPTFIDKSYVYAELNANNTAKIVRDSQKNTSFMIAKQTIYDSENNPVGIIIAGKSIGFIYLVFMQALPYVLGFMLLSTLISIYLVQNLIKGVIQQIITYYEKSKQEKHLPNTLDFDRKTGKLIIGNQTIDIPLDSNQYYFCKAIFSNVKKRWELDELLEQFGDDPSSDNWRKVYDTMTVLNKKTAQYLPVKLIELKEKTYILNPDLHHLIKHIHTP